jgi:uncharacterized protein (TIGR00255 family)
MESMTGFGEAIFQLAGSPARFQIKSKNSRFLEIDFQIHQQLRWFEYRALQLIQSRFSRGKIEVQLAFNKAEGNIQLNQKALNQYEHLLQKFYNRKKVNLPVDVLVNLPGVFEQEVDDFRGQSARIEIYFARALLRMERERSREGKKIESWLRKAIRNLIRQNRKVEILHSRLVAKQSKDIKELISRTMPETQKISGKALARFIWQENKEYLLSLYSSDITEEVERNKFHLQEMQATLMEKDAIGKKLEFYSQELLREVNTFTAKTRNTVVNQLGIEMKSEIEKIREQIRNVE